MTGLKEFAEQIEVALEGERRSPLRIEGDRGVMGIGGSACVVFS